MVLKLINECGCLKKTPTNKQNICYAYKNIPIADFDLKSADVRFEVGLRFHAVWQFPLINIYFSATGEKRSDFGALSVSIFSDEFHPV